MCNLFDSSPTITNCTFTGNLTDEGGGGLCNLDSSSTVSNSILLGNVPDGIYDSAESTAIVTYSNVQGGYAGAGNIDAYPGFVEIYDP